MFTGADTRGHRARTTGRLSDVKVLIFAMQQKEAKINFQSTAVVCPRGHRARTTGRLSDVKVLIFAMQQKEAKINFQSTAVVCPLLLSVLFEERRTASAIAAIAGVTQSKAPSMASATTANSCRYSSKLTSEHIN